VKKERLKFMRYIIREALYIAATNAECKLKIGIHTTYENPLLLKIEMILITLHQCHRQITLDKPTWFPRE
jgi:hypothetical protein